MNPELNSLGQPDSLDCILVEEPALLPTSGFASAVMGAIQQAEAEPAPLPFPWRLAIPGMLGFLMALGALLRMGISLFRSPATGFDLRHIFPHVQHELLSPTAAVAGPILLALAACAAVWWMARRILSASSASML